MFLPVNLESKLRNLQTKTTPENEIIASIKSFLEADAELNYEIENRLSKKSESINTFDFNKLETRRIFHLDHIKSICIDYRLRFLDSAYFKPQIPQEAIAEIKKLEREHNTSLDGFKIMAPSKLMKLDNADDPLLFAPMGNGYFYLIHKWGNDLHPLRKWLYLPFKNINNTLIFAVMLSFLLTLIVPNSIYDEANANSQFWFLFLFIFKAVGFILIFYGVSLGKNFNSEIWNSRYYNG